MNIIEKLQSLTKERGWTEYRLVKESGLPASTIANIFHRNTNPSIYTLEVLCNTFGITLSQFFAENKEVALSEEQSNLLEHWARISDEQRTILLSLMETMR